jgi:homoserine O-succinyltransferase
VNRRDGDDSAGIIAPLSVYEGLLLPLLDNTWHDTAEAVVGNWIGCVYQVTHGDRRLPFMPGIDPNNPLGL